MKKILLIVLVLIVGCAKEPINLEALNERDDVYYTKDTNKPYTGAVFTLYPSGEKNADAYIKDGKIDGKVTVYKKSGQIEKEGNFKDGERDGKWTGYYENGQIKKETYYKDGKEDGKRTRYWSNGQIKT